MALDRLTQVTNSGVSTSISFRSTGITVSGIITATSFVGDGSGLTGVVGSGSGVVIKDDNATVGTASTINFGSNLSVSAISAGIVTVTGTDTTYTQAAVADGSNVNLRLSGSDSTTDDILLTAGTNITFSSVGAGGFTINSSGGGGGGTPGGSDTQVQFNDGGSFGGDSGLTYNKTSDTLSVAGGLIVTGVTTSGGVNVTTGNDYKINTTSVLSSTTLGSGVVNSSLTSLGTLGKLSVSGVSTFVGLTTFKNYVTITELGSSSYDGIRFISGANFALVSSDSLGNLIINSQSTTNRTVEINGYSQFYANSGNVQLNNGNSGTTKVGSAITFTSNTGDVYATTGTFTGIVTTSSTLFAKQINVSGVVTATSFSGDGSGLTGIVAQGSGVTVKDDGTLVGIAGTIDFGSNLSVSPLSAGIVTVTGSAGGGTNYWVTTSAGIHTLSSVGIGTTNPSEKLTVYGTGIVRTLVQNPGTTSNDFAVYDWKAGSSNHWSVYTNASTNYFRIFDNSKGVNGLRFIIDDSGNFGIKNLTPTSVLDVTGDAKISSGLQVTGVTTVGVITGTSAVYYGNGTNLATRYEVTNSGFSDWVFTAGVGITAGITNDPVLYLARGQVYEFKNNGSSSHPFRIYTDSSGTTAYTAGTTNNDGTAHTGAILRFEIPMNAPNTLYYRCQNHSGMGNTISVYPNTI